MVSSVPPDDVVVSSTRRWLERVVIGLSLCPFAKSVHERGQIRYFVSQAPTQEALLAELRVELATLAAADPQVVETTLFMTPRLLTEFLDFNAFLPLAERELEELGLAGVLQLASFHPDYLFREGDAGDSAHLTNRSPYPTLHLLREESVTRAVRAFPDAAQIFEKNIATLRALGHEGFRRVSAGEPEPEPGSESASLPPATPAPSGFDALGLSAASLRVVGELGFETPTAIQSGSVPPLLAGKDLVGQSQTGSGKTLAFALPMLERLELGRRELQGLVLCPTRELSAQVAREVRKLGRGRPGLSVVVLAGGEPAGAQCRVLEKGVHLAVGTPGRVLDHLRRRSLRVHGVRTVVLDEADRMLDMGFQPDIEKVLKALPPARQTVFFSATFPASIRELSARYQKEPAWVSVEQGTEQAPEIRELLLRLPPSDKLDCLLWVVRRHAPETALVFANQKIEVARIEEALRAQGISVASLHGDLEQRERDRVMAKFRNGSTRVLVATDVAARGIDLESLDLVVNHDLPDQPETYVHRIGRTGRAGKAGIAISFCTPADEADLQAIERYTARPLTRLRREADSPESTGPAAGGVEGTRDARMDTLRIAGGRKDKLRPGDILGALTGDAGGLPGEDIGKIEIHERFSFVAVKKSVSAGALDSLRNGRIKGRRFRVERVD